MPSSKMLTRFPLSLPKRSRSFIGGKRKSKIEPPEHAMSVQDVLKLMDEAERQIEDEKEFSGKLIKCLTAFYEVDESTLETELEEIEKGQMIEAEKAAQVKEAELKRAVANNAAGLSIQSVHVRQKSNVMRAGRARESTKDDKFATASPPWREDSSSSLAGDSVLEISKSWTDALLASCASRAQLPEQDSNYQLNCCSIRSC